MGISQIEAANFSFEPQRLNGELPTFGSLVQLQANIWILPFSHTKNEQLEKLKQEN